MLHCPVVRLVLGRLPQYIVPHSSVTLSVPYRPSCAVR